MTRSWISFFGDHPLMTSDFRGDGGGGIKQIGQNRARVGGSLEKIGRPVYQNILLFSFSFLLIKILEIEKTKPTIKLLKYIQKLGLDFF